MAGPEARRRQRNPGVVTLTLGSRVSRAQRSSLGAARSADPEGGALQTRDRHKLDALKALCLWRSRTAVHRFALHRIRDTI